MYNWPCLLAEFLNERNWKEMGMVGEREQYKKKKKEQVKLYTDF